MRRLLLSLALIAALIGLSGLHVIHLEKLTGTLIAQVRQTEDLVTAQRWNEAAQLLSEAQREWETHAFYLHVTLRHTEIDGIRACLYEVQSYLSSQEDEAECLAVSARLINQLELLLEAELPTIKNLL